MPKTTYFPESDGSYQNSAISVTWTPSSQRIYISGYYDGCVGIQSTSFTLADFFKKIGIKPQDAAKALKQMSK